MKVQTTLMVILFLVAPSVARAQDDGEDDFYQDPDAGEGAAEEGDGADVAVEADVEADENQLPFRGSAFIYENIASIGSSGDLSPETTFSYAMSYSFRPRYYFADWFNLRLRLDLEQELTDSGTTTSLREPVVSDMWLDFYFSDLLDSVIDSVDLGAYLRLQFPTSKISQGRTLVMGVTAGTTASYTADVLEGLKLTYGINITRYFNQEDTGRYEAPLLPPTPATAAFADAFFVNGTRNPAWLMRNTLAVDFSPIENLTLSVSVTFYDYWLYGVRDVSTADLPVDIYCTDPAGCPIESRADNTDRRSSIWYIIELSYSPLDWLGLALGFSTFNGQLDPSSNYYTPFFNRYTQLYFDISLTFDALVNAIRNRRSSRSVANRQVDEV